MIKIVVVMLLVCGAFIAGRDMGRKSAKTKLVLAHWETPCDLSKMPRCDGPHSCTIDEACNVSQFIVNIAKGDTRLVANDPEAVKP